MNTIINERNNISNNTIKGYTTITQVYDSSKMFPISSEEWLFLLLYFINLFYCTYGRGFSALQNPVSQPRLKRIVRRMYLRSRSHVQLLYNWRRVLFIDKKRENTKNTRFNYDLKSILPF